MSHSYSHYWILITNGIHIQDSQCTNHLWQMTVKGDSRSPGCYHKMPYLQNNTSYTNSHLTNMKWHSVEWQWDLFETRCTLYSYWIHGTVAIQYNNKMPYAHIKYNTKKLKSKTNAISNLQRRQSSFADHMMLHWQYTMSSAHKKCSTNSWPNQANICTKTRRLRSITQVTDVNKNQLRSDIYMRPTSIKMWR